MIEAAFRDAIDALKKRDARIAEMEAVLREAQKYVEAYHCYESDELDDRIDAILNKGSDTNG